MAAGEYQHKGRMPFIPGMEAAGTSSRSPTRRAMFVWRPGECQAQGACSTEEVIVAPSKLTPLPKTFDFAQGATFLAAHGTAYYGRFDRGEIKQGETLLGTGRAAVSALLRSRLAKVLWRNRDCGRVIRRKRAIARGKRRRSCGGARRRTVP